MLALGVVNDVRVVDADPDKVLRTEWVVTPRDDGGTDPSPFESGSSGPTTSP